MPRVFFFVLFVGSIILGLGLVQLLLLRLLHKEWWRLRWVRRASWSLPPVSLALFLLMVIGEYHNYSWLTFAVAPLTAAAIILEVSLMFSLPVSGIIQVTSRLLHRRKARDEAESLSPAGRRRRVVLQGVAAAVPVAAMSAGLDGVVSSYAPIRIVEKKFRFPQLPPGLNGFRILQLSDLHLRHYVTLDDLEQVLSDAEPYQPDLVLVTGDVSDDLHLLPDALRMISGLNPPQGVFASLGNHEYYRGIKAVKRIFGQSAIPLLVNARTEVVRDGARLGVAGIDDPVILLDTKTHFFADCLDRTFEGGRPDVFTVLMTHRPDGFPAASERGVQLSLAGHTHGGQVGLFGRSLLEGMFPERFLWGEYHLGESSLYTTSGAGHWFPFRLGCPAEAPIIELSIT